MTGEANRRRARHRAVIRICVVIATAGWTVLSARAQEPREAHLVANGFRALDAQRYELALNLFERARAGAPGSAELLTYVGLGQFKLNRHDDALESLDHARQRDPDIIDSAFLFYRASCLRALGLRQLEHAAWNELIEFDPVSRFATLAREATQDAPPRDPSQRELLVHNGQTCWEQQPRLAAAFYREALANDPASSTPEVVAHLVAALNQAQDFSTAAALAQTHAPTHASTAAAASYWQCELGVAYMGMEDWEQAADALAKVAPGSAWRGQATVLRALCLSRLDRHREANMLLKTVNPNDVPTLGDEIERIRMGVEASTTRQAL